jgi:hypothetical protein
MYTNSGAGRTNPDDWRCHIIPYWIEYFFKSEGHFIMLSNLAGFGYVDAIREVFSGGGPHHDQVPTKAQKNQFNVLYPRDSVQE